MKKIMLIVGSVVVASAAVFAQDWVSAARNGKLVLVDNAHLRLVDVVVAPGGKEPMHTHPEYIEYVISPAKMKVVYAGKTPEIWDTEANKAYYGTGEPPHSLENVDTKPFHLLLIELKDRPFQGRK